MSLVSGEQLERAKLFIFQHGRLLERKLFEFFFEDGTREACVRALRAYQNDDGGFGNGLEADLLCPDSTAIGAETALFVLEMLAAPCSEMVEWLARWVVATQGEQGMIPHPPQGLFSYPFQPWWRNPDDDRVLVVAALLRKQGLEQELLFKGVRRYYLTTTLPAADYLYGYPHLAYLKRCGEGDADQAQLATMVEGLPVLLEAHHDHYPLFSRYWFYAAALVDREILVEQAGRFVNGLQEDGGIKTPYPDLPWWRPIFTLDGLILLKRYGLL